MTLYFFAEIIHIAKGQLICRNKPEKQVATQSSTEDLQEKVNVA